MNSIIYQHIIYTAHSAHVTNVRWTPNGRTLFSVGGADHAAIQWRVTNNAGVWYLSELLCINLVETGIYIF
jgi:WD40 repeat protein